VTEKQVTALAARLEVDLSSRGVCPACLSFVVFALEEGDGRRVAGAVTRVASMLWDEGLDVAVRVALERAVAEAVDGAAEGRREFEERGFRSRTFRAVVRRLAEDLAEESRRMYLASLN
jgi:hypothetical protein